MFFNDVHIMVYVAFGILGLIVGNILPHINKRLIEHKRVFDKSFFTEYPKNFEPHYIHMILIAVIYVLLLYKFGLQPEFIQNLDCVNTFIDTLKECVRITDSNKSNIINLGNDFIYDKYNKSLFKNNKVIPLTKKENLFLDFLLKNHDCPLSYEKINMNIWNGSMTHDSLRSLIKELRKKTYKELIKNISGMGYRVDILTQ